MVNLARNARLRAKVRCRNFSVLLMEELATGVISSTYRIPCKSWSCPRCAKKKADQYSVKAMAGLEGHRVRFLTLTIRPQRNIVGALKLVAGGWNRLNGKIKRKYGKYKYFKVLEVQKKTEMPHLHILVNIFIDKAWLNSAVIESGFGPICVIKDVSNGSIFNYIIKYLKKGLNNDNFESALLYINGRRLSFSRDFHSPDKIKRHRMVSGFLRHGHDARRTAVLNIYEKNSLYITSYPVNLSADYCEYFDLLNPQYLLSAPV